MNPVIASRQGLTAAAEVTAAEAPAGQTTTLYDVMAALQTVVEPEEDDLVVAIVVHWLRTGRMTVGGDVMVAA